MITVRSTIARLECLWSTYNNPESTASTKDKDGWVATGDAGFFEENSGHLRIIDRAKDVGKISDGRLFAPKVRGKQA